MAALLGVTPASVIVARGARDLEEVRRLVAGVVDAPPPAGSANGARGTLERFRDLRDRSATSLTSDEAHDLVRELRAGGADLRALRLALTGAPKGPELWRVLAALPRDEALRRTDAAL